MSLPRKLIGQLFLSLYRTSVRTKSKCFSLLVSGGFAEFGKNTVIATPLRLSGEKRISLGEGVFVGAGSWLQALPDADNGSVAVIIGSGTSIAGTCVISAVRQVCLEERVLVARNVYISDHIHRFSLHGQPVLAQGLDKIRPVLIKRGAWLGQNVVICPGVTVGIGSVIGANSVVTESIPDYCLAVGTPARVVKKFADQPLVDHKDAR